VSVVEIVLALVAWVVFFVLGFIAGAYLADREWLVHAHGRWFPVDGHLYRIIEIGKEEARRAKLR
jgi:hypothetical protein